MKWFKHMVDARRDEKLTRLFQEYGHRGYCIYWWTLELIAESMDESDRHSLTHPKQQWAKMLGTYWKDAEKILGRCRDLGLIFMTSSGEDVTIFCEKLLSIRARKKPIGSKTCHLEVEVHTEVDRRTPIVPLKGDDEFDRFWREYPKRIGKGAALKAWKKIRPTKDLVEKILSAVDTQKTSEQWKKDHGQFIPNPATWLNQSRWEDEGLKPAKLQFKLVEPENAEDKLHEDSF